nr:hypothetical protein GCM10017745_49580 [Saccharothrix mutabilis subsp. capreolus]
MTGRAPTAGDRIGFDGHDATANGSPTPAIAPVPPPPAVAAGPPSNPSGKVGAMAHARFESLGVHLPDTVTSTEELLRRMHRPPRFDLEELTGIKNRRTHDTRPDSYEDSFVLATKAASRCLHRSRYRADELEVLICASVTRLKDGNRSTSNRRSPRCSRAPSARTRPSTSTCPTRAPGC